jgi:hypothetical protein
MMTESSMIAEPTGLGLGLGKAAGLGVGDGSGPLLLHTSGPASALTTTGGVTVPPVVAAATSAPTPTGLVLTKLGAASTLTAGAAVAGLAVSMGVVALAGYLTYRLVNVAVK